MSIVVKWFSPGSEEGRSVSEKLERGCTRARMTEVIRVIRRRLGFGLLGQLKCTVLDAVAPYPTAV